MRGYASLHPITEQVVRELGIGDEMISQGWGDASASAGYHMPVGRSRGRKFSHCFDLRWACYDTNLLQRLCDAAVVPFARDWPGNQHIHCIHIGICADDGKAHLLSGPRAQLVDVLYNNPPLNGLTTHSVLQGFVPPPQIRAELRAEYAAWVPDCATRVISPDGRPIRCYAWFEGESVVCEVRALCSYLGAAVLGDANSVRVTKESQVVDLAKAHPYFDGRFWRGEVRGIAEALGYIVNYTSHGTWAEVTLRRRT